MKSKNRQEARRQRGKRNIRHKEIPIQINTNTRD